MKYLAIFFGLVGVMIFLPVFGSTETPEEFIYILKGAQNEICKSNDTCFNPSTLVVAPDTKVTWIANESGHKISSGIRTQTDVGINTNFDGEFQSNYLNANDTFSHVFTQSGKYSFHSLIFGHASGQVIVTKSNDSPVYSDEKCDLLHDLKIYENLLHNDIVVRTFLSKYPHAISFVNGIDESKPPKAPIVYESGTDDKKVSLDVYVREEGILPTDCFSPVIYTYKYYKDNKPVSLQYYYNEKQLMVDFLNNYIIHSPLKQFKSGILIDEIQCKENLVLIQKYDGSPACVTPETKQKLIERDWTKNEYYPFGFTGRVMNQETCDNSVISQWQPTAEGKERVQQFLEICIQRGFVTPELVERGKIADNFTYGPIQTAKRSSGGNIEKTIENLEEMYREKTNENLDIHEEDIDKIVVHVNVYKEEYHTGDVVVISGYVESIVPDAELNITVRNPLLDVVLVSQVTISEDGTFTESLPIGRTLWEQNGIYSVSVQYGKATDHTDFLYLSDLESDELL